jgi:phosphatidylinositol-3-phosphatase
LLPARPPRPRARFLGDSEARSRVPDHDGEPRLGADRREPAGALHQFADEDTERGEQLLRHRAPEQHQLPRGSGRLEFQQALGPVPRLAQPHLHAEHPRRPGHQYRFAELRHACPICGTNGKDAAIPILDETQNETSAPPLTNLNGQVGIPADTNIVGISSADQLVSAGKSWKSYQEGLPAIGADGVNVSDGFYTLGVEQLARRQRHRHFKALSTTGNAVSSSDVVYLYAVKHNPFVYFASVQNGENPNLSLAQSVPFEGPTGLYADLKSGSVPSCAFIAPNQCDDMHGGGNGTAFCNYDADDNGTQTGLNPSLILQGDLALQKIVTAIRASSVWWNSKSAIVILWDENDYSTRTSSQVLIVDTNYGLHGITSEKFYIHYSLTKTLDAALGLQCLNHACDAGVSVMSDLFQE